MHHKLRNYLALVLLALVFVCSPTFAASKPTTGWEDSSSAVQNDIPFVTVGNHSGATAERAISEGPGLDHDDNGANSTYVIKLGPILSYYYSTGATTQQTAVNAILGFSSLASQDICYYNGTNWVRLGKGANGTFLGISGGALGYYSPAGSGTVTSVDVAGTAGGELTFSGGPVTGSGTITGAWANQTTNKVFAAPNGSTGTPTFRALVAADLPNHSAALITSGNLAKARSATEGVYNDQSNTYTGTTTQDFSASGTTLVVPIKSTPGSPTSGEVWDASGVLMYRDGTAGANRTVADTASTQTLSAKTLASPKVTTKITFDGTGSNDVDITFTDPAAARSHNIPDLANGTFSINDGTNTAYGTITNDANGRQKTVSPGTAGYILTSNGSGASPSYQVSTSVKGVCGGYVTGESGVCGSTTDQTNLSNIYFTPDPLSQCPGQIDLWNGSTSVRYTFSEVSYSVTGLTADTNYDIWAYDSGGNVTLTSTAWTNATARATAISLVSDGYYCKSGDTGKRLVATIRTYSPSSNCRAIDTVEKRFIWNAYNPRPRPLARVDTTDNWTYTSTTIRQANNSTSNQVALVCGVAGRSISISCTAANTNSGSAVFTTCGIGIDSTTTNSAQVDGYGYCPAGNPTATYSRLETVPTIGYHYYPWLEVSYTTSGTTTHYGDNGATIGLTMAQTGLTGVTWQ